MKRSSGFALLWLAIMATAAATGSAQNTQNAPAPPPKSPAAASSPETVTADFTNTLLPEDRQNLRPYKAILEKKTTQSWLGILPAQAKPPVSTPGQVRITCWVHTDGRVTGMALEHSSGKVALDRAAWGAVTSSVPYQAFPYGIAVDQVRVRFTFDYNGGAGTSVSQATPATTANGAKSSTTNPPQPTGQNAPLVSRRPQ
jgi:TonB family protein